MPSIRNIEIQMGAQIMATKVEFPLDLDMKVTSVKKEVLKVLLQKEKVDAKECGDYKFYLRVSWLSDCGLRGTQYENKLLEDKDKAKKMRTVLCRGFYTPLGLSAEPDVPLEKAEKHFAKIQTLKMRGISSLDELTLGYVIAMGDHLEELLAGTSHEAVMVRNERQLEAVRRQNREREQEEDVEASDEEEEEGSEEEQATHNEEVEPELGDDVPSPSGMSRPAFLRASVENAYPATLIDISVCKLDDGAVIFQGAMPVRRMKVKDLEQELHDLQNLEPSSLHLCTSFGVPLNKEAILHDIMAQFNMDRLYVKPQLAGGAGGVRQKRSKEPTERANKDAVLHGLMTEFQKVAVTTESMDVKVIIDQTKELIEQSYIKDAEHDARALMEEFMMNMSMEKLNEIHGGSCFESTRAQERILAIFDEVAPFAFPEFSKLATIVTNGRAYPWTFFEFLFTKGYLKGDGSWSWADFRKTVENVQLIKKVKEREAKKSAMSD